MLHLADSGGVAKQRMRSVAPNKPTLCLPELSGEQKVVSERITMSLVSPGPQEHEI